MKSRFVLLLLLGTLCLMSTLDGCHNPRSKQPATRVSTKVAPGEGVEKIQHIVFLIKENRTFDHYFGTYPERMGLLRKNSTGKTIPLSHAPDETPWDIGHSWRDALIAINNAR